jgi:alanine dehydrogenase
MATGRWGPTLLISRDQIEAAVNLTDARAVVEEVLRGQALGRVAMPAKITMDLGEFGLSAWNTAMPAYIESLGAAGFKWVGGFAENRTRYGLPFLMALILIQDPRTGYPLAVMDGVHITNLRTAALNALIVQLYARPDSRRLGLIGAGVQARFAVAAIREVLALDEVRVFDIDPAAAADFARDIGAAHGTLVTVCSDPEGAVVGADVVITATPATSPIVRRAWLGPGVTAISVGSQGQEFDDEAVLGAGKLICDSWEQCTHLGELRTLAESGRLTRSDVYAEIGDTIAGVRAGRESPDEYILVVPIGLGSLDIGLARLAYERLAPARGVETFRFFESPGAA